MLSSAIVTISIISLGRLVTSRFFFKLRQAKPRAARVSKRAVEEVLGEERGGNEEKDQTKRRCTSDIAGIPPTPVHPRPTMRSTLPLPSTPFRPLPNSYAVLATPPVQFYQNPQSPYTPSLS
jgi:hypothetical protein